MASNKTVIVTGASRGIGAAVVQAFLGRGYNVVATSRSVSKAGFAPSPNLALVDGDIGQAATAANIAQTANSKFGSIDALVNNAGVFLVMGAISEAKDIADAVIYLTEARHITGEVLHVDGGMHVGKW